MIPLLLSALVLSAWVSVPAQAQDVAGATDHPMLTRYPKSVIKWHDVQTFMPYSGGPWRREFQKGARRERSKQAARKFRSADF